MDSVCYAAAIVCDDGVDDFYEEERLWHSLKYRGKITLKNESFYNLTHTVWNKIYRKSIIDKYNIDFPEGLIHEDFSFYTKYMALAPKTYCLNEYLYFYRKRQNSIMSENVS